MSDRFSDTTEMPVPKPRSKPNGPQRPKTERERKAESANRSRSVKQRPSTQPKRKIEHPARQRTAKPTYPQPQFRRASYQEQMPELDEQQYQAPAHKSQPYFEPEPYEEEPPHKPKQKKKRKKHHKSCLRRIITSILTFAVVIFALYSCIAMLAIKQLNYEETGTRIITSQIAEADPAVRNVLIIGTDNREDERGRADTMILLSFSKHNHTFTMTSLMRDCYVTIPNHGNDKLNAAYAYGGATLLMDTITNNFGIQVDDYICVNFKAFVHIADAIGGLKIEISDREAEAINIILESEVNRIMGDDPKSDLLPSGGTFLLNGKQALAYARIRYVGNADFERTERQRKVLDLMIQKLKHPNPAAIPKILAKAIPEIKTNMSTGSLYLLSLQAPKNLLTYDMQKLRLPADGTFSDQMSPDGQMVLAVDYDANMQLYLKAVNDPVLKPAEPEVAE